MLDKSQNESKVAESGKKWWQVETNRNEPGIQEGNGGLGQTVPPTKDWVK
jgi:hypothetical protein